MEDKAHREAFGGWAGLTGMRAVLKGGWGRLARSLGPEMKSLTKQPVAASYGPGGAVKGQQDPPHGAHGPGGAHVCPADALGLGVAASVGKVLE